MVRVADLVVDRNLLDPSFVNILLRRLSFVANKRKSKCDDLAKEQILCQWYICNCPLMLFRESLTILQEA